MNRWRNFTHDRLLATEKIVGQPQKQQTSRGFLFSLKKNSELVRCYSNDSKELIRLECKNYKKKFPCFFNLLCYVFEIFLTKRLAAILSNQIYSLLLFDS